MNACKILTLQEKTMKGVYKPELQLGCACADRCWEQGKQNFLLLVLQVCPTHITTQSPYEFLTRSIIRT